MKDGKMCIGMVGCGQIMPSTAKGILASQHCIIDAVMDIDADAAKEKGEMYAVPYYTDLWEFLARPEMDIVYIAVPHALHVPIGIEAARAGKHVIVEKPMATAVEDAKMLVAECREAGVKLTQAMGMRYGATTKLTHDLIQAGAIGDFTSYLVRSIGMKDAKYWSNGVFGQAKRSCWRAYKGMAGGGILASSLLTAFNYQASAAEQSQTIQKQFFAEIVTIPLVIFIILVFAFYRLSKLEKQLPAMQAEIDARKAAEGKLIEEIESEEAPAETAAAEAPEVPEE